MTDEHGVPADDALRDRLRGVDPAASLGPADRDAVARLLEDTMSDPHTTESRTDGARHRSGFTWVVAAAAVAIIAAGIGFGIANRDDSAEAPDQQSADASDPAPTDSSSASGDDEAEESVTKLSAAPDAATGRCRVPAADIVAQQDLAFDGVVESVSGRVVTLRPTEFFTGEQTDLVTVTAPDRELQALLASVDFREGERYLVSATGGDVTVCGISDVYSPDLAQIYDEAFPG